MISPRKIGIDLGTANSLVYVPGRGIVINEPSVVAVSVFDNRILAVGKEAKKMIGMTPDSIIAHRPLKDGVIADYRVTEAMIKYFINKVSGRIRILKPEVMISVPAGITSTEKRAVIQSSMNAGAKATYVVKEPVLAAIGAGVPINSPSGNMVVDIGGGTTEVAVISLGGIVSSASTRVGGDKMDVAISNYIKNKYNLAIGERTAEDIKISIGSALPQKEEEIYELRGRDLGTGLPKNIEIKSSEIVEAISDQLKDIIYTVKTVLRETPPELSADVMDKGMILSGGGALLSNIDELITEATGVPAYIAKDPLLCVVIGTGVALENLETYKRSIMAKK
ncbi:MAG: rod shape-determining protein [Candidatus Spechtbacteria bacterium RIFCSPLOWO2_12_FULL_38_22]|uniref:Cell shape-determining protein MreB n=1 Tax=Candidatus Spechtbacteria bacterium RIFCSPLOWO2_12_FULL_38_22 TaxID=1802165 RepID=A0A1G2HIX0_9BACT|nr:MAG: rod shape-determining protein [Candidatus Spechtbacteria bacterium RIFCSPHIGHO2_01_FULL_38_11]OGZ60157.1 MAG: rod shape-determining protein [Candidatus Spechtbacteria bacterium RIFCSPHIGHO2_12_FULL_38_30]OGZ61063.1 MAG: rod shape-determining protein [Candidatus Spechtbacteria bacterium RIFCSPLOWO2_01_FULL_38_20]OGZ62349.1 MAG: rod shape-determining protein [Candidatus Spechtbacteria bacterium RIFCSPLOWO2_12_FULL_38_22]